MMLNKFVIERFEFITALLGSFQFKRLAVFSYEFSVDVSQNLRVLNRGSTMCIIDSQLKQEGRNFCQHPRRRKLIKKSSQAFIRIYRFGYKD